MITKLTIEINVDFETDEAKKWYNQSDFYNSKLQQALDKIDNYFEPPDVEISRGDIRIEVPSAELFIYQSINP